MPSILLIDGEGSSLEWDLENPLWGKLTIKHVAHMLSRINRFVGATHGCFGYSVAQHSWYVSQLVPERFRKAALLHDGHEPLTGLGDLTRPAVDALPESARIAIQSARRAMDIHIANAFGFAADQMWAPVVKQADDQMLAIENAILRNQPSRGVFANLEIVRDLAYGGVWEPDVARERFYKRFLEITHSEITQGAA